MTDPAHDLLLKYPPREIDPGERQLVDEWLARAKGVGEPIRARLPHETREGVFEGIDASGAFC